MEILQEEEDNERAGWMIFNVDCYDDDDDDDDDDVDDDDDDY